MQRELMPAGRYFGYLRAAVTGASANAKQTPFIQITVNVQHLVDKTYTEEESPGYRPVEPFTATVKLFLSDAALEHSERKLLKLGFRGNYESPQFDPVETDKGVELECRHEMYNGHRYEKWDLAPGNEPGKLARGIIDRLNARFLRAKSNAAPPSSPPSPPASPGGPPTEDDIPF